VNGLVAVVTIRTNSLLDFAVNVIVIASAVGQMQKLPVVSICQQPILF